MLVFPRSRNGYTLVEVLVVTATVCFVAAILLSAVQSVREAARQAQCSNNLRQIGLALQAYTSSVSVFPGLNNGRKRFSPHAMLLPFIDHETLFYSMNFDVASSSQANQTAASMKLGVFLCPSDHGASFRLAGNNYAGNTGYGFQVFGRLNGIFSKGSSPPTAIRDVRDGTSSTAMMSEWILGALDPRYSDARQNVYSTPTRLEKASEFDQFTDLCSLQDLSTSEDRWGAKGSQWIAGEMGASGYNHNLGLNQNSCFNGGLVFQGAWTAGSRHASGANVLFADGHTRHLTDSISLSVWRALGTRDQGEIVDEAF